MTCPGRTRIALRRAMTVLSVLTALHVATAAGAQPADPRPLWSEGAARKAIVEVVTRVTTQGGPEFMPAPERIATFDNDGTLWSGHDGAWR